jgi:hypothetical protein
MQLIMMISVVDLSLVDWAEKKCVNFPNSEDSFFSLAHNRLPSASLLSTRSLNRNHQLIEGS